MAFRYKRVARTTSLVEETMRAVDSALAVGFNWSGFTWNWRDMFTTETENSDRTESDVAVYVAHTKRIKIVGQTDSGHRVTAIAEFGGCTHEFVGDADYSEPFAIKEIQFVIQIYGGEAISRVFEASEAINELRALKKPA